MYVDELIDLCERLGMSYEEMGELSVQDLRLLLDVLEVAEEVEGC